MRNTCPSGCRTCISRAFHGISVGGNVTSKPAATHCLCTSSTLSTAIHIHTPLSAVSSPPGPNVAVFAPLPRLPWPPRQRNIWHSPDPTAANVAGFPQSQHFLQPNFSNHATLSAISDTFNIGVICLASISRKHTTTIDSSQSASYAKACYGAASPNDFCEARKHQAFCKRRWQVIPHELFHVRHS